MAVKGSSTTLYVRRLRTGVCLLAGAACVTTAVLVGCDRSRQVSTERPGGGQESSAARSRGGVNVPLREVPEQVRRVAEMRIQAVSGSKAAPGWQEASLGEGAVPLYRPDVEGVAYYEMPVFARGQRAGVITVSTGPHDFPVVFWSDRATGGAAALLADDPAPDERVHRIHRLGPVDYVAEDERGEVLHVSLGSAGATSELVPTSSAKPERSTFVYEPPPGPVKEGSASRGTVQRTGPQESPFTQRKAASWAEAKARYAESRGPALSALRQEAGAAWSALSPSLTASALPTPSPGKTYFEVEATGDAPLYNQIPSGTSPNTTYCASGCGATAWAIVAGWFDRRAWSTSWASGYGRIFTNGGTDVPADMDMTTLSRTFIWSIRDSLGTDCSPGVPAGWTLPGKMPRMTDWMSARYIGLAAAMDYSEWFVTYDHIRLHAMSQIRARRPAVIGIGSGSSLHYPVAIAYQELPLPGGDSIAREFFVNMGHGGRNDGWIPASIWLSGSLAPAARPNTGQDCRGLEGRDYLCCMKPYLPDC